MNNKHWISLLIGLVLILSLLLSACGQATPTPTPAANQPSSPAPQPSSPAPQPSSPAPSPAPAPSSAPAPAPKPVETRTLKFSHPFPPGASLSQGFDWFAEEYGKRTEGRYKVEVYPMATLVSRPAALQGVKAGVAEIVMTATGTHPTDFPLSQVTSIPLMNLKQKTLDDYVVANQAMWEFINGFAPVKAEYKDVKLLLPFMLTPSFIASKSKEIHLPKDLKGLKVGGSGSAMEIVKSNGGASVFQTPGKTYENIDKGLVDAALISWGSVASHNLQELVDYWYDEALGAGNVIVLMNIDAWNGLSAEDQKIMTDTWNEAFKVCAQGSLEASELDKKVVLEAGHVITQPTPAEHQEWVMASTVSAEKWSADAKAAGVYQETIGKTYTYWKEILDKYSK